VRVEIGLIHTKQLHVSSQLCGFGKTCSSGRWGFHLQ